MDLEGFILSIALLFLGLIVGYFWGEGRERSRIQVAFSLIEDLYIR